MPYMMAGFPDHESSLAVAASYVDNGADLIELGIPFSDPLADGPTIHAAATAALAAGASMESALEVCESVAGRVPVVLMVYSNMILAKGGRRGVRRAGPPPRARPGRSSPICRWARGIASARRSRAPASTWSRCWLRPRSAERRAQICAAAKGFVYVVSTVGTTGERAELPARPRRADRGGEGRLRGPDRGRFRDRHPGRRPRRSASRPTA